MHPRPQDQILLAMLSPGFPWLQFFVLSIGMLLAAGFFFLAWDRVVGPWLPKLTPEQAKARERRGLYIGLFITGLLMLGGLLQKL